MCSYNTKIGWTKAENYRTNEEIDSPVIDCYCEPCLNSGRDIDPIIVSL